MMRRTTKYVPDPSTVDLPLTEEEVDEMIDRRRGMPSGDVQVNHLLRRVKATIRATRRQVADMNKHIATLTSRANAQGAPITMSVEDALRYASPDVVARHAPGYLREQLDNLSTWTRQVADVLATARDHDERLRHAARIVFNDPTIPSEVRERFGALLRAATPDPSALAVTLPDLPAGDSPTPASTADGHATGAGQGHPTVVDPTSESDQTGPGADADGPVVPDRTHLFADDPDTGAGADGPVGLPLVDSTPAPTVPRREDLFAADPEDGTWTRP